MDTGARFGDLMRDHRRRRGLSQAGLAGRSGMSIRGISDLERGARRHPRHGTVNRLAAALDLTDAERACLVAAARPPQRRADGIVPRVPVPLSSFVGREDELSTVAQLLGDAGVRVVTITGPGGIGKTRLAEEVASRAQGSYRDGATLVPFAALTDSTLVVPSVLRTLGVNVGEPSLDLLVDHLRHRRLLLVLDNFEHLTDATPVVSVLADSCPDLGVLVTSRQRLHIRGERTVALGPLPVPDLGAPLSPSNLLRCPSVRLFAERATAVQPGFAVDGDNGAAVAEVCARLEGLPLALEIAAMRVRAVSPATLLALLGGRLDLLEAPIADAPVRHHTLRACIAWSHDLLDKPSRVLYRRLASCAGGFELRMVEALAPREHSSGSALDSLAALVEAGLVNVTGGFDGTVRYTMLEVIREDANERLTASCEKDSVCEAHAEYVLHLVEGLEPALSGPRQREALSRLDADLDNIRAALGWAHVHDGHVGLRIAAACWRYWKVRGFLAEGRRWLTAFLDAVSAGQFRDAPGTIRVRALQGAGALAGYQGDHAAAEAMLTETLSALRRGGDQRGLSLSLKLMGNVAWFRCDYARAATFYQESLAIDRHLDDRLALVASLSNAGSVAAEVGELAQAEQLFRESLAVHHRLGERSEQAAISLINLADVLLRQGKVEEGAAAAADALGRLRELNARHFTGMALNNLGIAARRSGRAGEAAALHVESLAINQQNGDCRGVAYSLTFLGDAIADRGDAHLAMHLYRDALDRLGPNGNAVVMALCLERIAALAARHGDAGFGAGAAGAASSIRERVGAHLHPIEEREVARVRYVLRARLGERAFARAVDRGRRMSAADFALSMGQPEGSRDAPN